MRIVLSGGNSGGGSATVAIAIAVLLFSCPGFIFLSIILICWLDIKFETDPTIYVKLIVCSCLYVNDHMVIIVHCSLWSCLCSVCIVSNYKTIVGCICL